MGGQAGPHGATEGAAGQTPPRAAPTMVPPPAPSPPRSNPSSIPGPTWLPRGRNTARGQRAGGPGAGRGSRGSDGPCPGASRGHAAARPHGAPGAGRHRPGSAGPIALPTAPSRRFPGDPGAPRGGCPDGGAAPSTPRPLTCVLQPGAVGQRGRGRLGAGGRVRQVGAAVGRRGRGGVGVGPGPAVRGEGRRVVLGEPVQRVARRRGAAELQERGFGGARPQEALGRRAHGHVGPGRAGTRRPPTGSALRAPRGDPPGPPRPAPPA